MTWSRRFDNPIVLEDGRKLVSLRDAGRYVAALPKSKHREAHWQTAAYHLLKSAEHGWAILLADIAMRQALGHGNPAPTKEPRRKRARKLTIIS